MFHGTLDLHESEILRTLQKRIAKKKLPSSKLDESLLVASWNIREFGKNTREPLALHLIAEIIGQFDLMAVVELREDIEELAQILSYLGPYWKVVYSDVTEDYGGNWERLAFIYDERAVQFCGLAGSGIPPRSKQGTEYISSDSFWRAPYSAAFRSGNFDFVAISAHIRWGGDKKSRLNEINRFVKWIDFKMERENRVDSDVLIFGDFNTETSEMLSALESGSLKVPAPLVNIKTNLQYSKHYDHILHRPVYTKAFTNQGGVLDVFSPDDLTWFPGVDEKRFTYQLSDHFPIWAYLKTDDDGEKLDQVISRLKRVLVKKD